MHTDCNTSFNGSPWLLYQVHVDLHTNDNNQLVSCCMDYNENIPLFLPLVTEADGFVSAVQMIAHPYICCVLIKIHHDRVFVITN